MMRKLLALFLLSALLVLPGAYAISSDKAQAIINDPATKVVPTSSSPMKAVSSSFKAGGGCITKYGWTGNEWVKRDVFNPVNGKVIPGKYCVAYDPHYRILVSVPSQSGNARTDGALPANWAILERISKMTWQ